MNILVLCTGNSARSILLECLLRRKSEGRISAFSAGSQPSGKVHPQSLKLLASLGYDTAGLSSKSWDVFAVPDAPTMHAVITVCGSAASETCPIWPGAPVTAHWGVEDPAAAKPEAWQIAFQAAYDVLERRADALCALPFEDMSRDDLKPALDRIGQLS
ncbi:MAG: arsenate reductase ArsC [Alphaproteobacteria bacterium]|nr:arsenate reductase ArsC [Alphaproteobacteria bacterium]NNF25253.1 arsenate reductase ArsC [Paracoccaceae bacterium]